MICSVQSWAGWALHFRDQFASLHFGPYFQTPESSTLILLLEQLCGGAHSPRVPEFRLGR